MTNRSTAWFMALCAAALVASPGCGSSLKTPASADVAVSKAAVDDAMNAGGAQLAPHEFSNAREKLMLANQALAAKDYRRASELASEAQADAKLAQSKASSAKAQAAADALHEDVRVLREELERLTRQ